MSAVTQHCAIQNYLFVRSSKTMGQSSSLIAQLGQHSKQLKPNVKTTKSTTKGRALGQVKRKQTHFSSVH